MITSLQRVAAPVLRAFVAVSLVAAISACRDVPKADARTPYERLASDSAHADSGAFATLPARLGEVLDVRALLDPTVLQSLPLADCVDLSPATPDETRRRLQMRLADSTAIVLYAVGDRTTGVLGHVEFIRRMPGNGQRGFTWDVARDKTTSLWWSEYPRGISRRAERGEMPRGSPVPRTLRALGRQLLTIPCADSTSETPR